MVSTKIIYRTDKKNKDGKTPLDDFKRKKYAMDVDKNCMLLLHHACNNGDYLHLILFLIQAHPESSSAPDNDGKTPLQYLKKKASCKDKRGMFLLHRQAAYSRVFSVKILPLLFEAYPEAV